LRERVEAAGGTFRLQTGEGTGTRVAASLPL
jgi:signal transduction histidine kinase